MLTKPLGVKLMVHPSVTGAVWSRPLKLLSDPQVLLGEGYSPLALPPNFAVRGRGQGFAPCAGPPSLSLTTSRTPESHRHGWWEKALLPSLLSRIALCSLPFLHREQFKKEKNNNKMLL